VLTATIAYQNAAENLDRSLEVVAQSLEVSRETDYYLAHIGDVKSIDDFLADKRLIRYAMIAYGLGDMAYATGFIRKLLEGGVDDSNALANRMADQRYANFATAFNFDRYGPATTSFDRTQQATVDLYQRQTLEENVGEENEGARLALYFERQAPNATSSLGLRADQALLRVTQVALGLSPYMSNLSLEDQQAMIEKKLDVADLKDPAKLQKLLGRFTALYDVENPVAGATPSISPTLNFSPPAFSADLLSAIQNLKLR
jgi:hypothetical protein